MKKKTKRNQKKQYQKRLRALVCLLLVALFVWAVATGKIELAAYMPTGSESTGSESYGGESSSEAGGNQDGEAVGGALTATDIAEIKDGELSIHFLEVGNQYTGDCTLIKVGNTEILIDAGSRKGSAETIVPYINQFCTDGTLEYVIATHAHQDHIAGFVGTTKADGIFESFVCQTIIDYPLSNSDAKIRTEYETLRDEEVKNGAKHYTALQCWNNENGASRSYTLAQDITLNVLYQEFYEKQTSDENDYSVCVLLSQGDNHYLFTGDLEGEGEESLVAENDLPKCELFKGGHHGSPTSNTLALLDEIRPEIVCVCCCCGSTEYTDNMANTFPSQAFVDRVAAYTDRVYVTTIVADNEKGYTSMNGNIIVYSQDGEIKVRCSNNALVFKETQWFKDNRICPEEWE